MDLPLALVAALESGNCVLFIGSGVGWNMLGPDGEPMPDGANLAVVLAKRFGIDDSASPELSQLTQLIEVRHGRGKLIKAIDELLGRVTPDTHLQWLMSNTWKAIFTTNYDNAIEQCYELLPNPTQSPVTIGANSEFKQWDPRFQVPVIHLHGSLSSDQGKESILITDDDYAQFRERRQMLFDLLRLHYASSSILYLGYSNRDPNWRTVLSETRSQLSPGAKPPESFRVAPDTGDIDRELLASRQVTTLDGDLAVFRATVETVLGHFRVEPHNLSAVEKTIPSELVESFRANPAATTRLLNSWTYVNQAAFSDVPNTESFHKGDKPNWALVGAGINFQRDLEQTLYDRLLDWATDPSVKSGDIDLVLAPAGYGVTTLLMATASWFVRNKVGTTLFLRPGASLNPGDVEFAARHLPEPLVFFIDNAADFSERTREALDAIRTLDVRYRIVMGERLNEWRQGRSPLRASEFMIEPLSDDEIERLLASLEFSNSLGRLAELDPDLRFAAVRERNQKELLVTMRELTEARAFDAIIEDEFRGIGDPAAQRTYSLVCGFTRVRALVRDQAVADGLGLNVVDLYSQLRNSLEGLCLFESVDEARGIEALRARHQVIADIVWDRCLTSAEREEILLTALRGINLTFGIDVKALEIFTRDDDGIDSLSGLEAKIRFFEEAARKDPSNAFIRQHYARMLRREKKLSLALEQIHLALEISPRAKTLSHTRGVILRDMATDKLSSRDVSLRHLAQSEQAFASAIRANPKDEYSAQSLAELYLDWAATCSDETEKVLYVSKAQETVLSGLATVRSREGLYRVSSRIEHFLGDTQSSIDALRNALSASPSSPTTRYLLGRVLLRDDQLEEAARVLREGVRQHPDDPNLCMTYSLALHAHGKSYKECLAVLSLGRLRGVRDPAYVATLGGMLAMDGDLDASRDVFSDAAKRQFSHGDQSRIAFIPSPGGVVEWVEGRVVSVRSGFAFVGATGKPDFYCRSSHYAGKRLIAGQGCSFEPGFSARGPSVTRLRTS